MYYFGFQFIQLHFMRHLGVFQKINVTDLYAAQSFYSKNHITLINKPLRYIVFGIDRNTFDSETVSLACWP